MTISEDVLLNVSLKHNLVIKTEIIPSVYTVLKCFHKLNQHIFWFNPYKFFNSTAGLQCIEANKCDYFFPPSKKIQIPEDLNGRLGLFRQMSVTSHSRMSFLFVFISFFREAFLAFLFESLKTNCISCIYYRFLNKISQPSK